MAWAANRRGSWLWRVAVAAVVAGATTLTIYWVFLVPIFASPDETTHLDYALNLLQAGHLLNVRDRPPVPGGFDLVVHPDAIYLKAQSDEVRVRVTNVPMPPSYGTCTYFQQLDVAAPPVEAAADPARSPSLITQYPFGYYAVLALWLKLVHALTNSLTALFFSARIFSVLLLTISLVLSYGIARELGFRRPPALGLCALIGFFPMTSFVSSYVQSDNLTFTLVSLSTYLALRARREPRQWAWLAGLGIAAGLLLVTKWHIYFCLFPWLAVAALMRNRQKPWPIVVRGLLVILPSIGLGLVQLWVAVGSTVPSYSQDALGRGIFAPTLAALHAGPLAFLGHVSQGLLGAYTNFYLGGQTFIGFWGRFGNDATRLVIGSPRSDAVVRATILLLTMVVIVLTIVGRARIGRRLIAVARRGRPRAALQLAIADPLFNGYLTFTALMFALYSLSDNFFAAQGRNWLPFLLPIFLLPVRYAGRAFRQRPARRGFSLVMAGLLGAYCLMGSVYAVQVVRDRFYQPAVATRPVVPFVCWPLPKLAMGASLNTNQTQASGGLTSDVRGGDRRHIGWPGGG